MVVVNLGTIFFFRVIWAQPFSEFKATLGVSISQLMVIAIRLRFFLICVCTNLTRILMIESDG